MSLLKSERETVIRWDEEDRTVNVYSSIPAVLRKMARLGLVSWRETKDADGKVIGADFRLSLDGFRWGLKRKAKPLSQEHKNALLRRKLHS